MSSIHGILHAVALLYESPFISGERHRCEPSIPHRLAVELTVMPMVVVTGSVQATTEQEAGPVSPVRKTVIRAADRAPLAERVYTVCHDELP